MIIVNKDYCDFCGTCVSVCSHDAIELFESRIMILEDRCTECLNCVNICPLRILEVKENER